VVADYPGTEDAFTAQRQLTLLYIKEDKPAEAEAAWKELAADFGQRSDLAGVLVVGIGHTFREARHYAEAVAVYEELVRRWPESAQAVGAQAGIVKGRLAQKDEQGAEAALAELFRSYSAYEGFSNVVIDLAYEARTRKRWGMSHELFQYFVNGWPDDERAMVAQRFVGKASIRMGDDAGGDAACEKLLGEYGQQVGIDAEVGAFAEDWAEAGEYKRAEALCKLLLERWPESAAAMRAYGNLVKVYIYTGDEPNATAQYEKLRATFGGREGIVDVVESIAEEYYEFGSMEQAYEKYRYIAENWRGSERAIWAKTGMVMSKIRGLELEAAEAQLWELFDDYREHKELAAAVHEIVEQYRNVGAYTEGREIFAYMLENPFEGAGTMLELQVGVALQSIELREPNKVEEAVEKVIADYNDHPNIAKALFQVAEEHYYAKNYEEAIALWHLIETEYSECEFPNKKEIPYMLATCYSRTKEYNKAAQYYKEALEEYPNCQYAYRTAYELGKTYRRAGNFDEAVLWFDRQVERFPEGLSSDRALFKKSLVYMFDVKDYKKAVQSLEQYRQSYEKGESIEIISYNLACCYEKLGQQAEAVAELKRGLAEYPDCDYADSYQKKLSELE